jgi:hypothetical protein
MGMTSAAEAKLDARIRPDIAMMRSTTPYPKRRLTVVGADQETPEPASSGPAELAPAGRVPAGAEPAKAKAPARRAVPEGPVRLTRRGRIVVGVLIALGVLGVAAVLWLAFSGRAVAAGQLQHGDPGQALHRVVVRPGQSLWTIASSADPSADPRVVIKEIVDDNELPSTNVQVGQVLWVPRS